MMKDYFMDFGGIPEIPGINDMEPEELEEACVKSAVIGCGAYLVMAVVLLAVLLLSSCTTTREVTVEKVRTDTVRVVKTERDSVCVHDSIRIFEKGDTVMIEKWHAKLVERLRTDTLYEVRTDSVPVPYPVHKLVEKELTWWQRMRMGAGDVMMVVLAGGAVYLLMRIKRGIL